MKDVGYGKGYAYAHDYESGRAEDMSCLPEELLERIYYKPTNRGFEGKFKASQD
jgi:putative ATPase